jgi:hypothetical protein
MKREGFEAYLETTLNTIVSICDFFNLYVLESPSGISLSESQTFIKSCRNMDGHNCGKLPARKQVLVPSF